MTPPQGVQWQTLPTKLQGPRPNPGWLDRSHLLARFERQGEVRVVLIAAAAGAGKTVLASQWLARLGATDAAATAWLSLDQADSAPARFFSALVAALERAVPGACPATRGLLGALQLAPLSVLVELLITDLLGLEREVWLVLDDYHCIADDTIHQALIALIDHLPTTVRLVVTSRVDPPWPLSRWRVRRQLLELRAVDLRLTPEEVQTLIRCSFGVILDRPTAAALHARTEGWIAGVQLAGISLEATDNPAILAATLRGTDRHVMDYLLDEVLEHQPVDVQQLLLACAVAERFCTPLCAALLEAAERSVDLPRTLRHIERHQIFLVPLDNERVWFRFHHLFRDLLLHRLRETWGAACVRQLLLRAGQWFAEQGLIDEALGYLLAAGAPDTAAALVEAQLHPLLDNGMTLRALSERLARLPEPLFQRRPALLVARAYLLFYVWDLAQIPALLGRATALLEADTTLSEAQRAALHGDLAVLGCCCALFAGDTVRGLPLGQRALEHVPATHHYAQGMAVVYHALHLVLAGQPELAIQRMEQALAHALPGNLLGQIWPLTGLATLFLSRGQLDRAAAAAERLFGLVRGTTYEAEYLNAPHVLGMIAYERNDLEKAKRFFSFVAERRYRANARSPLDALHALAMIALIQADLPTARSKLAESRRLVLTLNSPDYQILDETVTAWLDWRAGDRTAGLQLLDTLWGALPSIDAWLMVPQRLHLLMLIEHGSPASLEKAEALLATEPPVAVQAATLRRSVELLALRALLRAVRGDHAAALEAAECAVLLAEPCGLVRTLVDIGAMLAPLLAELARRGVATDYLRRVLMAFPAQPLLHHSSIAPPAMPHTTVPALSPSLLTHRERDVLLLLAQRLTDAEIAQQLGISPSTVKTHIGNLLGKLNAHNRREVVVRARALGLL